MNGTGVTGGFELDVELALAPFTLAVDCASRARVLGVFGPSGSGKTSLLESVAGWRRPARGRIAVAGRVLFDSARGIDLGLAERGIGCVPQDLLLLPGKSARENVLFGPRARAERLERVSATLEIGPLLARDVGTLSGGERQRVALARALCSDPAILLFDEPLASIDVGLRSRILPYLLRVREEFHLPMLFVSHDPTEVRALCDEVIALERGRVVGQGAPADVLWPALTGFPSLENVFPAEVESIEGDLAAARVAPGAQVILGAHDLEPADRVLVALAADDILVSLARPTGLSARNVLAARVAAFRRDGGTVWLETDVGAGEPHLRLAVALTATTFREFALEAGKPVFLVFKASACRLVAGR